MRYAADDVLNSLDNMQPKMTLELDEDLLKLLPENMKDMLTDKVEEQVDGPLSLTLDADLQPKFDDKTINGRIEAALAKTGPLSISPALTLQLERDLLTLLPADMRAILTSEIADGISGPLALALDADVYPRIDDKTIGGRIAAELAKIGPLSATFELTLDDTGIKQYGENVLSLSYLLQQVPPLFGDIGKAGQSMGLTLDPALKRLTSSASDTEQAWLHLDKVVPKAGKL